MEYQLLWGGRLWSVSVPSWIEGERDRWIYAQNFVAAGGSRGAATRAILSAAYPGISWSATAVTVRPVSFDAVVTEFDHAAPLSASGMSSPSSPPHSRSRKPPPSNRVHPETHGGSGIANQSTHGPLSATANASSHRDRPPTVGPLRRPSHGSRPAATPHSATSHQYAWLGSSR